MIEDLTARRWDKGGDNPQDYPPEDALHAALRAIRESDVKPQHVIVLVGRAEKDGGALSDWFQSGRFNAFEQVGLLHDVMRKMGGQ